jgi:hypothetical protein
MTLPPVYVPPGSAATAAATDSDVALQGDQPAFLHVALRRDLSISAPEEIEGRIARFRQVRTRGQARDYLNEVASRLDHSLAANAGSSA